MKRAGTLWPALCSWPNLTEAARRAALGKKKRPDVARYLLNLENELATLRRSLQAGGWKPGPYRSFRILEPKPRQISAAPFADRVVHHAFTQIVEPVFEKRFPDSSYACRKGLGTHRALAAARSAAARCPFVLQCDIRKYFATLDHQILLAQLERVIKCRPTLRLAEAIISGSDFPRESPDWYFPGDTLFTPSERPRGLPLGNQTSQFFANVYLNPLDHFVTRQLRPAVYVRYVDDFLLFDSDRQKLTDALAALHAFAASLRLLLHPGKSRIYRVCDGFPFLGWRIFPDRARLQRANVVRFRRKMAALHDDWDSGGLDWKEVQASIAAWIGHAMHGDTWRLREQIFEKAFPVRPAKKFPGG